MGRFKFTPSCCCGQDESCGDETCEEAIESGRTPYVRFHPWTSDTFPNVRGQRGNENQYGYFRLASCIPGLDGSSLTIHSNETAYRTAFDPDTCKTRIYTGDQTGRLARNYTGTAICNIYSAPKASHPNRWVAWKKCVPPRDGTDYDIALYSILSDLVFSPVSFEVTELDFDQSYIYCVSSKSQRAFYFNQENQQDAIDKINELWNDDNISSVVHRVNLTKIGCTIVQHSTLQEVLNGRERTGPSFGSYAARTFYIRLGNGSQGVSTSPGIACVLITDYQLSHNTDYCINLTKTKINETDYLSDYIQYVEIGNENNSVEQEFYGEYPFKNLLGNTIGDFNACDVIDATEVQSASELMTPTSEHIISKYLVSAYTPNLNIVYTELYTK